MPTPSLDQLKRAITIKEQIQSLEAELASILSGAFGAGNTVLAGKRKYTKKGSTEAAPKEAKPKKVRKQMSEEGRAKIVAAQKKRWAKIKKEKKAQAKEEAAGE